MRAENSYIGHSCENFVFSIFCVFCITFQNHLFLLLFFRQLRFSLIPLTFSHYLVDTSFLPWIHYSTFREYLAVIYCHKSRKREVEILSDNQWLISSFRPLIFETGSGMAGLVTWCNIFFSHISGYLLWWLKSWI